MKKRKIIIAISSVVLLAVIALILVLVNTNNYRLYDISSKEESDAYNFLTNTLDDSKKKNTYFDYISKANVKYGSEEFPGEMLTNDSKEAYGYTGGPVGVLEYTDELSYEVVVNEAGYYNIMVDYYIIDNPLTNFNVTVSINNQFPFEEAKLISVPILWEDETKNFPLDSYNDETIPQSMKIDTWRQLDIYDNKYSSATPLLFYLNSGENKVTIKLISSNGRLALGDLKVAMPEKIASYNDYIAKHNQTLSEKLSLSVNAIDYTQKNSSFVRMMALNKSFAQPFDNKQKKLNIIDGGSWTTAGQELSYEIDVEKSGIYNLSFYYRNNKNEFNVFRSIYIDGKIPFEECLSYELPCTESSYKLHTVSNKDGEAYGFYLSAGKHQITIKAETAPLYEAMTKLQTVVDHINQLSLEVLKITGSTIDENRTWDITKYIPETENYLKAYDTVLKGIVNELSVYSNKGPNSSSIGFVQRAIKLLKSIIKEPGKLPLYLDKLYSGTSSINQLLGDVLDQIAKQPMYLESLHFTSNGAKVDYKKSNFFANIGNSLSQLMQTFFSDKYSQKTDDNVLNVWVNRPITYIDTMQRLIDADYNQKNAVKVKLSAMPDQSKLTLAVAANNAPDVVLGVQSHIPYDLAIRNGVYDLTNFDDFWTVADRFTPGSLLSFVVSDAKGDRVYAVPESLDFNVLAYRSDIFDSLEINSNLQTWEDAIAILPTLQRYGMNFYLPVSADNATKWFYQTSPMLLQAGGKLYSSDGLSAAINEKEAVAGLELLTSMYTEKSLPTSVPRFYSQFRNGTLPIGILDFNTYLQLKNAAPEIAGKWNISLPLGTLRNEGTASEYIDRTYISSGTSAAIMQTSKYKSESWNFIKWWTSKEVQTKFGYDLQSTYGPEYVWLSSNLEAIKDSQLEAADKEVILESISHIVDVVRNPGQYMVERGISNIWTATSINGEPLRVEIQNQVIIMNREIRKKMEEFGYIDSQGNVLVEFYTRDVAWIKEQIKKAVSKK